MRTAKIRNQLKLLMLFPKKRTHCKRAAMHLRQDGLRLAYTPKEVLAVTILLILGKDRLRAG